MRRTLTLPLSIALIAAASSPAFAVTGAWLAPLDLSSSDAKYAGVAVDFLDSAPSLGVAADGSATVVWSDYNVVRAVTRPPGGSFGPPVPLSAGQGSLRPQIAVAPDGAAVAVWMHRDGATSVIQAAVRTAGGSFGPPVDLSPAGGKAEEPQVAIAPDGRAVVAWSFYNGATYTVQVAARPPGGAFGAKESVLVSDTGSLDPEIAIAPDGNAVIVWARGGVVQQASRAPGGGIAAPQDVSLGAALISRPQVAVASDGTATVVWRQNVLQQNVAHYVVKAAIRPPGGAFGVPLNLSNGSQDAGKPQIAVGADGTTVVAWHRFNGQNDVVQAATRLPGGTFAAPDGVSFSLADAAKEHVAIGGDGSVTVVWRSDDGTYTRILAATRQAGGAFSLPVDLSGPGINTDPEIALGLDGAAIAVFLRYDGTGYVPRSALTANPPVARAAPAITGALAVGSALGCQGASFTGAASQTTNWLRGSVVLATSAAYTVVPGDQGAALTCRVRATNPYGSVEASSAPVAIPAALAAAPATPGIGLPTSPGSLTASVTVPIARSLPRISGSARVGRSLRCTAASFAGAATRTTQWLRGRTAIKRATRAAYKLTRRDRGKVVTCRTTARGPGGTSTVLSLGLLVR